MTLWLLVMIWAMALAAFVLGMAGWNASLRKPHEPEANKADVRAPA